MPQMSPMHWTFLLFNFILVFMLLLMINYFLYIPYPNKNNKSNFTFNKYPLIWKW